MDEAMPMKFMPKLRMSRPHDARALRSRTALRQALLELVEAQPFDRITIKDITAKAGVSYPVFFRRYESKQHLLEDIATEEVRRLLTLSLPIFRADRQEESLRALCGYIGDHRSLWTRLLTGGAGAIMREEFRRIALDIGHKDRRINPWLPRELAAPFVVSGLFEILAWWLAQPETYPVENIIKIIDALIIQSTARPIDIQLA